MRYSKQDICKASVKYIISIGDDDEWWRLQPHRSVSNEWTSKPGSWIYLKVEKSLENLIDLRKNNSFAINWEWHDPERFYWKTMLNMKMVILPKGQSIMKRIQGLFILVIDWLAPSAMEPFVCPIHHDFLHQTIGKMVNIALLKMPLSPFYSELIAFIYNPARCCDQQERKLQMWWIRFLSHICN